MSEDLLIKQIKGNSDNTQRSSSAQNQHTLKGSVSLPGVGLHTGQKVNMTMKPANPGFGIRFQRVDLPDKPIIKADVDLVVDTSRGTTLEYNGVRISTVEHLLAALVGMNVDNVLIELDGDKATAETYVWAYHVHEENGVDKEGILGGRHHFQLEKRNGEWRIKHRSTVFDWNQNGDATAIWSEKFDEKYRAKRDRSDDSYNYVQK